MRAAIEKICARFGDDYWLARDRDGEFPHEFHRALAGDGWLGVCIPEAYGGSGLGITEAAVMMETIAASGAGFSGASAVHMNIFGLNPVVVYGSDEQKRRMLPPIIAGKEKACFAVTEPNAGLETQNCRPAPSAAATVMSSRRKDLDHHGAGGRQDADPRAQRAARERAAADRWPDAVLHRARPPLRRGARDREDGRKAVDSNQVFIDGLEVPVEDRIGEEGRGFEYILDGFNPERILVGAEAVGLGRAALSAQRPMRKSAPCSAGRSARTRRSSIRSPNAGWSWKPPS